MKKHSKKLAQVHQHNFMHLTDTLVTASRLEFDAIVAEVRAIPGVPQTILSWWMRPAIKKMIFKCFLPALTVPKHRTNNVSEAGNRDMKRFLAINQEIGPAVLQQHKYAKFCEKEHQAFSSGPPHPLTPLTHRFPTHCPLPVFYGCDAGAISSHISNSTKTNKDCE